VRNDLPELSKRDRRIHRMLSDMLATAQERGHIGEIEALESAITALRALRDAPVGFVTNGTDPSHVEHEGEWPDLYGQRVRIVPLDTTAGVGK
jgi:hypothetical protein